MSFKAKLTLASLPFAIGECWWGLSTNRGLGELIIAIWFIVYMFVWVAEITEPGRNR